HAKWSRDSQRDALLLTGGWMGAWAESPLVTIFDVGRGAWITAIDQCRAGEKTTGIVAVPFQFNDRSLMWCRSTKSMEMPWHLVSLERNAAGSMRIDAEEGIALGRSGAGFLPPDGLSPGLAVGGTFDGFDSAAVDVIWRDGRLLSIAPLNEARRYAQVFRRKDGSFLVAGGLAGRSGRRTLRVPSLELLPAGKPLASARWQKIDFPVNDVAGIGLLSDDSLLVTHTSGKVERLVITGSDGTPVVERFEFPSLNRKRGTSRRSYDSDIIVRELSDGRIIVAGGNVQHHRIALLHDEVFADGAADHYVGVGEFSRARHYEIYEPDLEVWRESAFSKGASETAAVLDDGRVVTWGERKTSDYWEQANRYFNDEEGQMLLEISNTDGSDWRLLEARLPPLVAMDTAQQRPELIVIEDELFLFGRLAAGNRARTALVQWFNPGKDVWVTLWQSEPEENWYRDHLGRTVIRDLPNGKRIVLPVAGLSGRGSGG
ncbi:MAG: hypothetical protein KJO31_09690, partial [Gammaproteobacteria bacterium]|nr:hypothetical protein [Gammaproteobacteria bacterium]